MVDVQNENQMAALILIVTQHHYTVDGRYRTLASILEDIHLGYRPHDPQTLTVLTDALKEACTALNEAYTELRRHREQRISIELQALEISRLTNAILYTGGNAEVPVK